LKSSEVIIIHPPTPGKIQVLKAFLEAMNIDFEIKKKSIYKAEFVEKILDGDNAIKRGKLKSIELDEIWKSS